MEAEILIDLDNRHLSKMTTLLH